MHKITNVQFLLWDEPVSSNYHLDSDKYMKYCAEKYNKISTA